MIKGSSHLRMVSAAPKGKIIGAAEGNKEMADRHQGFGAYDVPFLGPTRTGMKDQSEHAADAEVMLGSNLQHTNSSQAVLLLGRQWISRLLKFARYCYDVLC